MEKEKVCPFMSNGSEKVKCLKEECQIWFCQDEKSDSALTPANCAVAYLPQVVLEIATHTRLIKASMEERVAI